MIRVKPARAKLVRAKPGCSLGSGNAGGWRARAHHGPGSWRPDGQGFGGLGGLGGGYRWRRRSGNLSRGLRVAIRDLGVSQLLLDLQLELIAGAAELKHQLANLAADLRQLLRAENHQRQRENEDCVGQTHANVMIPAAGTTHKSASTQLSLSRINVLDAPLDAGNVLE